MAPARALATAALVLWFAAAQPVTAQTGGLALSPVAQGLSQPLALTQDPSNPRVQYVVQRTGRIRVLLDGALQPDDFLDLTGEVGANGGEQGLLGLALPADYGTSGHAFVNFTNREGHTVVARFSRSQSNPLAADPATRLDLQWSDGLRIIRQPFSNHNGGTLRFGPDGMLYVGMGDGGSGNDPLHAAQSPDTLLGKMLRVDVHVTREDPRGMVVPRDNPFLPGNGGPVAAMPEIWAFGFRNPWKFSFDDPRLGGTGAMLVGDVGQGAREEVNHEPEGAGGRNYGWRLREGTLDGGAGPIPPAAFTPLTAPVHEYPRSVGQSITGGYVYRGTALDPFYAGRYFFGDFVARRLFSLRLEVDADTGEATAADVREHTAELGGPSALGNISAIEVDAFGELLLVDFGGRVLRLEAATPDGDGDLLPDWWERRYGLDASSAAGDDGAAGDPDGDGRANAEEYAKGGHPRGFHKRYLAEGAISPDLFDVSIDVLNPDAVTGIAAAWFQGSAVDVAQSYVLGPRRRVSIDPGGQVRRERAEFATLVESDRPVVVSRSMTWDRASRYGSHAERAVEAPSERWWLAEGATHSGFNLFYLLQNPNPQPARVEVRYLRPAPLAPITKVYTVAAVSRLTIWVNLEDPGLSATDVSAAISALDGRPIVVERAMYLDRRGRVFEAGHAGAGVTAPRDEWLFAEGATGPFFDLFVLVANPGATAADVEFKYLLPDGSTVTRRVAVAAQSRRTVWVDLEDPRLANTAVSTVVRSTNGVPIVAERAMWWPGGAEEWYEAHVSAGATGSAARWAVAGGAIDAPGTGDTYVLVANVGSGPDEVRVEIAFEDRPPVERSVTVAADTRYTLRVRDLFPEARGRRFGVLVSSAAATPLVVEAAVYADADGMSWASGSNLLATRLP